MNGFVNRWAGPAAHRGNQANRAEQGRAEVAQDIAKHIGCKNHIELRGTQDVAELGRPQSGVAGPVQELVDLPGLLVRVLVGAEGANFVRRRQGAGDVNADAAQKGNVVAQLGGDARALLSKAQIDPVALTNRHAVIPHRNYVRLLERTAAELACPAMTGADFQYLEALAAAVQDPEDPVCREAYHKLDLELHRLVALRSGLRFDAILTDIEMPDMNGFEFAETIKADQRLGAMPIIALSSMISPAAIERGRQAGFHDYVAKFDRPGLIAALKEQTAEMNQAA